MADSLDHDGFDSDESDSSSVELLGAKEKFVMDKHQIKRVDIPPNKARNKIKKHRKRRQTNDVDRTSSSTPSEDSLQMIVAISDSFKEEFYDAIESYHALPEKQEEKKSLVQVPMSDAALILARAKELKSADKGQSSSLPKIQPNNKTPAIMDRTMNNN